MSEYLTEAQRVQMLVRHLEGGNQTAFARKTGIDGGVVSHLCRGTGGLHLTKYVDRILNAYPAVSGEWLATGIGYPGDISIDEVKEKYRKLLEQRDRIIHSLSEEIETQRKIIEKLL